MAALGLALFGTRSPAEPGVSAGWLVLLPVLAGALHGTWYGCLSAGLLCVAGLQARALQAPPWSELGSAVAHGWGLVYAGVGAIAGYFRDLDQRRLAQLDSQARAQAEELESLQRAFACLQWSHAQLEQQFSTQPHSLASVLDSALERMQELRSSAALAELILEVVASRTRVQAASLYALGTHDQVAAVALATLGGPQLDVSSHPLVQRALHTTGLVSIIDAPLRARAAGGVLAAVALRSSCAQLRLMLVVHQLPFDAFCIEELRNLHALLARLVDLAQQRIDALDEVEEPALQRNGTAPLSSSPWSAAVGDWHASARRRSRAEVP